MSTPEKTTKDLAKKLTAKKGGAYYEYQIGVGEWNRRYDICEFNGNKGWCLNTYQPARVTAHNPDGWELIDAYGYDGLLLRECKQMILADWNSEIQLNNEIEQAIKNNQQIELF